jgi:hypothetical protein
VIILLLLLLLFQVNLHFSLLLAILAVAALGHGMVVPANAAEAQMTVDSSNSELLVLAKAAESQKRLFSPAGDNAIEYYLEMRARDPNDAAVKAALVDLYPYAVIAVEKYWRQAEQSKDPVAAESNRMEGARIYALLVRIDPKAPSLPRLRKLVQNQAAAELRMMRVDCRKVNKVSDLPVRVAAALPTGAVQSGATGSPVAMVAFFLDLEPVRDEGGMLDAGNDPTVQQLLSRRLRTRFLAAIRHENAWEKRHGCNQYLKPPFADGELFSGSPDGFLGFRVFGAESKGAGRWHVRVDVHVEANYHIENTVVVVREQGRFVIDDILYDVADPENRPNGDGSLLGHLKF